MAVLLTGGSGKTSTRIAPLLQAHNIDFTLASRTPPSSSTHHRHVQFDWIDSSTWPKAFTTPVKAVYMMEPQVPQPWVPMIQFLDFAVSHGVTRFVLCAGTTAARGQDGMGRVWDAFVERGVEFCVLRPSWFMGTY
jgi:nucleoside-diphosphate-sugar epimerase